MNNINIGLISLGCAKNRTDSEIMLGLAAEKGYNILNTPEDCDVIIVNTCGFIESAKQESIDTILEMAQYKEEKCRALIVTGCLAERYAPDILTELPEVDAVVGVGDFDEICRIIDKALAGEKPVIFGHNNRTPDDRLPRVLTTPSYTAYLKIADGCNNNCTYCAIPKIRGHFRSRPMDNIIEEAQKLADSGVKEIILVAQDTTRYGEDLYGKRCLGELMNKLSEIDGIRWIRVHYLYPEALDKELIDIIAENDKICNYFDIPVQHASNEILRRMARRTTKEEMQEKIRYIKEKMPDAVIRTSIIVGFPGETEEYFEELCDFVREMQFDRMGAFTYSQEEDTPAADFDNQLEQDIKDARLEKLMLIQQKISLEINRSKIGSVVEVIAEGYDEDNFLFFGRSRGDSIDVDSTVYFATEDEIEWGDILKVKIIDADEYDTTGEVVERSED